VPVAGAAGVVLPGCECASVPVASSLIGRGVTPAAAFAFLLSAPAVNPVVLTATAIAFPGSPAMVLARLLASLVTAAVMGWLWLWLGRAEWLKPAVRHTGHRPGNSRWTEFRRGFQHDFLHAGGFLVLGAMAAATFNVTVPRSVLDTFSGSPWLSVLFLAGHGLKSFKMLEACGLLKFLFPATARALERGDNALRALVEQGLANTDARIAEGKSVTPAFLYAVLLWGEVRDQAQGWIAQGYDDNEAWQRAAVHVVGEQCQRVAIPRRFTFTMEEIWALQPRFEQIHRKRVFRLMSHPRFRAAFDFLLLRAHESPRMRELGEWWAHAQQLPPEMLAAALGGGGVPPHEPSAASGAPARKRRRRRKPVGRGKGDSGGT